MRSVHSSQNSRGTVSADGEVVGTVPREFWEEWTDRIKNDPETCLSTCPSGRPAVRDA